MFRHVVLFRWRDDASPEDVEAVLTDLRDLLGRIPSVRSADVGTDAGVNEGAFDACVVADFDDADGYVAYRDHPEHREFIRTRTAPLLADRATLQYERP